MRERGGEERASEKKTEKKEENEKDINFLSSFCRPEILDPEIETFSFIFLVLFFLLKRK